LLNCSSYSFLGSLSNFVIPVDRSCCLPNRKEQTTKHLRSRLHLHQAHCGRLSTLIATRASLTSSNPFNDSSQSSRGLLVQQSDTMAMRTFLVSLLALANTSASPTGGYQTSSQDANVALTNVSIPSFYDRAVRSTLAKRWDGSPAMGGEFQKAKNKGCTLLAQMHGDDAQAGQMFEPPRDSAHSDYLRLSGK